MLGIRRREFITLLGSATAWPLAARAQQRAVPVVGFLHAGLPEQNGHVVEGFVQGLKEAGFLEGQTVAIEYRWGKSQIDQLPSLAAELVHRQVNVIVASPLAATRVAKAATKTIPIIFQVGVDPVETGLVASLNRPGGNLTGFAQLSTALVAKRMGLLREMAPRAGVIAVLVDPDAPNREDQLAIIAEAARTLDVKTLVLSNRDMEAVFASIVEHQAGAVFVAASFYWLDQRDQVVSFASRYKVPASYESREFTDAGGLMSYGTDFSVLYRQLGVYTGRVLKGEKAANLPVQQATKFEFIINLKTAKALGLNVPPTLLAIADEIIE